MSSLTLGVLLAALTLSAAPLAAQQSAAPADTAHRDSASVVPRRTPARDTLSDGTTLRAQPINADSLLHPVTDPARSIDAEVRSAVFELLENQPLPALAKLQLVAASPVALSDSLSASRALRDRRDLLFLLAEAQYQLGLDSAFQQTAQALLAGGTRPQYTGVLGAQLALAAYRSGGYARALQLATSTSDSSARSVTALVGGLAAYRLHQYATARAELNTAQQDGGALGAYARYMNVLAELRADTTDSTAGLAALQALASADTGELANQVRLTAAELAYERGFYDQAIALASAVPDSSGYAPHALLTKGWAEYKAEHLADAQRDFAAYATRYPDLPDRDESRLLSAQALLRMGKTQQAGAVFQAVADSATAATQELLASGTQAVHDAARALVNARAEGVLFIDEPTAGKAIATADTTGADHQVFAAAVSDAIMPRPAITSTQLLSLNDVQHRIQTVDSLPAQLPARVFLTSAPVDSAQVTAQGAARGLYAADVEVALARYELDRQLANYRREVAMLRYLRTQLTGRRDSLSALGTQLDSAAAQLAQLQESLRAAAAKIRAMLQRQLSLTRDAALENQHVVDSVRTTFAGVLSSAQREALDLESNTDSRYIAIVGVVTAGLDSVIHRHPVLALGDSVARRNVATRALMDSTRLTLAATDRTLAAEIAALAHEPAAVTQMRAALGRAQQSRAALEQQLVASVEAELRARTAQVATMLRHDTEAAEFGRASSSFFETLEAEGQEQGQATQAVGAVTHRSPAVVAGRNPGGKP